MDNVGQSPAFYFDWTPTFVGESGNAIRPIHNLP